MSHLVEDLVKISTMTVWKQHGDCEISLFFRSSFYLKVIFLLIVRDRQITSSSRDKEPKYRNIDTRLKNVHFEVNYKSVLDTKEEEKAKDKGKESDSAHDDAKDRDEQNPDISAAPPTPPQTTQDSSANKEVDATNDNSDKKKPVRKIFRSDDPISWYGILVPPSLRGAQKSFIKAINDDIPQLVTVVKEMQDVENLVYELRRQMQMTT